VTERGAYNAVVGGARPNGVATARVAEAGLGSRPVYPPYDAVESALLFSDSSSSAEKKAGIRWWQWISAYKMRSSR